MKSTKEIIKTLRTYDEWSVDEISEAADRLEELHKALVAISTSKYLSYENTDGTQYGIGVTDGHRYCANIARKALE